MADYGVVFVSHVAEIAFGLSRLLGEIAKNVPVTYTGGDEDGGVGSSFERVMQAIESNSAEHLLAFYDLGSSKMNLEMAIETTGKEVMLFDTALIESAYTATALLAAGVSIEDIKAQLDSLTIKR
ncbi:MAG: dihydroxyacetone kinase phosphoryl donor subunit DhaM [Sporolactobacillus sp.]